MSSGDKVWALNGNNQIFYKYPADKDWTSVGGILSNISAGTGDYVWGTNPAGNIFKCKKPCTGQWQEVEGGLTHVSANDTHIWGVNSGGNVYYRPVDGSGNWSEVSAPIAMTDINATGENFIFAVGKDNRVYRCTKPCTTGQWEDTGATGMKQISAGTDALYMVGNNSTIWQASPDGQSTTAKTIPGGLAWISGASNDYVYGANAAGNLYRCKKPCTGQWEELPGSAKLISAERKKMMGMTGPKGPLKNYALSSEGAVAYESTNLNASLYPASHAIDGNPSTFNHTQNIQGTYWQVDLGKDVLIDHIIINNRKDCCFNRLRDFDVIIYDKSNNELWRQTMKQQSNNQMVYTINNVNVTGRTVRVQQNVADFLHMSEFEVWGSTQSAMPTTPKISCPPKTGANQWLKGNDNAVTYRYNNELYWLPSYNDCPLAKNAKPTNIDCPLKENPSLGIKSTNDLPQVVRDQLCKGEYDGFYVYLQVDEKGVSTGSGYDIDNNEISGLLQTLKARDPSVEIMTDQDLNYIAQTMKKTVCAAGWYMKNGTMSTGYPSHQGGSGCGGSVIGIVDWNLAWSAGKAGLFLKFMGDPQNIQTSLNGKFTIRKFEIIKYRCPPTFGKDGWLKGSDNAVTYRHNGQLYWLPSYNDCPIAKNAKPVEIGCPLKENSTLGIKTFGDLPKDFRDKLCQIKPPHQPVHVSSQFMTEMLGPHPGISHCFFDGGNLQMVAGTNNNARVLTYDLKTGSVLQNWAKFREKYPHIESLIAGFKKQFHRSLLPFDASVTDPQEQYTYFFKGAFFTKYTHKAGTFSDIQRVYSEFKDGEVKMVHGPFDAVLYHPDDSYLFIQKDVTIKYDLKSNQAITRYRKMFRGVPDSIDASFYDPSQQIFYFFKGDIVWQQHVANEKDAVPYKVTDLFSGVTLRQISGILFHCMNDKGVICSNAGTCNPYEAPQCKCNAGHHGAYCESTVPEISRTKFTYALIDYTKPHPQYNIQITDVKKIAKELRTVDNSVRLLAAEDIEYVAKTMKKTVCYAGWYVGEGHIKSGFPTYKGGKGCGDNMIGVATYQPATGSGMYIRFLGNPLEIQNKTKAMNMKYTEIKASSTKWPALPEAHPLPPKHVLIGQTSLSEYEEQIKELEEKNKKCQEAYETMSLYRDKFNNVEAKLHKLRQEMAKLTNTIKILKTQKGSVNDYDIRTHRDFYKYVMASKVRPCADYKAPVNQLNKMESMKSDLLKCRTNFVSQTGAGCIGMLPLGNEIGNPNYSVLKGFFR